MSGSYSRNKGARGERLAARALQDIIGVKVERAARNGVDGSVDVIGLAGFAIEVKYGYSQPKWNEWWKQAVENAAETTSELPMLMVKPPRRQWIVRIPLKAISDDYDLLGWERRYVDISLDTFALIWRLRYAGSNIRG